MTKLFDRNSTKITISEFYDNYLSGKYNFEAKYQRKSDIWSDDKKSFLIDSILKNYPIPSIFLRPVVDNSTGKTKYDVVDGKQRLETIINFIEDKIQLTTYFSEDEFIDKNNMGIASAISGKYFEEIKQLGKDASDYVKQFWTYVLNVEYLYEDKEDLISGVFDRLNRNGEPLTKQELRKAKYSNSILITELHKLAQNPDWGNMLRRLRSIRMEDEEFISEILFLIIKDQVLDSAPDRLDELYDAYYNEKVKIEQAIHSFESIFKFVNRLDLDFENNIRLCGTTHLYAIFSFAWYCTNHSIDAESVKEKVKDLYKKYYNGEINGNPILENYKSSALSRTRSISQRNLRLNAMKEYCGIKD